jgi:hypothetical protein
MSTSLPEAQEAIMRRARRTPDDGGLRPLAATEAKKEATKGKERSATSAQCTGRGNVHPGIRLNRSIEQVSR